MLVLTAVLASCSTTSTEVVNSSNRSKSPEVTCDLSPLTNLCYEPTNPVLIVKIDDVSAARPQYELNAADVVVVEPVEAGLTRLMAVYNSSFPEIVGPVRSARITDLDLATSFGRPGFAYSGATSKLIPYLAESELQLVGAPQGGDGYFRAEDRPAPHDYLANTSVLLDRIEAGFDARLTSTTYWNFGEYSKIGKQPYSIEVIWPSSRKTFIWDNTSKIWTITSDGDATYSQKSDGTMELARATTVFIQETLLLDSPFVFSNGVVTPYAQTFGTGNGWLLTRGQVFYIQWQRFSKTDLPVWVDKDGDRVAIADGNLWWLIAPRDESQVNLVFPEPNPATPSVSADKD